MIRYRLFLAVLFVWGISTFVQAQQGFVSTGGDIYSSVGNMSYSVGQVFYTKASSQHGSVQQGVQQCYGIEVITGENIIKEWGVELTIGPNPTEDILVIALKNNPSMGLSYQLYDVKGILLIDKVFESTPCLIDMSRLVSAPYFLKIKRSEDMVITYTIVKN